MGRTKQFDRDEVLDAAVQVFWKKGYSDTSLSDLEKATGVNKSGLYSEFKDKDDIFLESLKRYNCTAPARSVLEAKPLGWKNIESLLKINVTNGQKGCFLNNTLREYSIVPQKVRTLIEQNSCGLHDLVVENLKATKLKKDPELLAKMILTFASGISLKLNAVKPETVMDEIEEFLEMVKI